MTTTQQKAKEIVDYVMDCCDVERTAGTPFKEMVKEVEFLIDSD